MLRGTCRAGIVRMERSAIGAVPIRNRLGSCRRLIRNEIKLDVGLKGHRIACDPYAGGVAVGPLRNVKILEVVV